MKQKIHIDRYGQIITQKQIQSPAIDTQSQIFEIRHKYRHLEQRAFVAFNRRLKSHALTWDEWGHYLNRVIDTEVLADAQLAQAFDQWMTHLSQEDRL